MRTRKLWNKKHGGLSQWGLSNRPRIRLGTVKSLNAPWELLALRRDYAKKIDPCRMLVWLGRHTVQNMVKKRAIIGSGQYTLLSGRPVKTGQVLFEFKFTSAQSEIGINSKVFSKRLKIPIFYFKKEKITKKQSTIKICYFTLHII